MASMVTTVPLSSSASSSFGIAVISLDFSSTRRCASTRPLVFAQAETICTMAFFPGPEVPRSALPDGDDFARRQLGNRRHPGGEALFQLLRVERREDPVEGVVRGNAARQLQKAAQPLALAASVVFDLVPPIGPAQNRRDGDQKNLFQ